MQSFPKSQVFGVCISLIVFIACQSPTREHSQRKPQRDVNRVLKAAEGGDAAAQVRVAEWYTIGWGVDTTGLSYPERLAEAAKWYRKAAEQGHKHAQWELGHQYETGLGVPKDRSEAMKWYRKAAEQGHGLAKHFLEIYLNEVRQAKFALDAAEQGKVRAQSDLAQMYMDGRGVTQDYAEAMKWYRKAAEQKDGNAQYQLGRMYEEGLGVTKDLAEAKKWYRMAAKLLHSYAGRALERLEPKNPYLR